MTGKTFLANILLIICGAFLFQVNAQVKKTSKPAPKTAEKKDENLKVIREGVGIEGIVVGKSTMNDVAQKFGKSYKWITNKKYSYQMTYSKLGLSFYICQADKRKEIFDIEIRQPYKAKTSKGIILGKSTTDDIERIYGKSKDGLEFRGVSFYYAKFRGKKVVTVIDVVENSGIRQCKENK